MPAKKKAAPKKQKSSEETLWDTANTAQVVSEAKGNMSALPGQLFYSTQIPVCLWLSGKNEPAGKCRAVSELELASAA